MLRSLMLSIVSVGLALGSAGIAAAQKKPEKPDQAGISGVVKKVDDKSITISVATQKGQPAEDTSFPLASDTKISVLGKAAKTSEIIIDKPAHITLNADKKVVAIAQDKVGDKGAGGIGGTLKKVDDKANTVVVAVVTQKGHPPEEQTYTVQANAKISVQGDAGKLGDLKIDMPVQLRLDADKKVVGIAQEKQGVKFGGIGGTLKKIDDKAQTVVVAIATQKGQPAEEQTFNVLADAKILVLGNAGKLGDLKIDMPVQLKIDADKKVVGIFQEKPGDKGVKFGGISGTLKKIDDKTVVIAVVLQKGQPAEEQTYTLLADAKILVLGNAGKISDLKTDKPVQLKLDADKKVIALAQGDVPSNGISGLVKKVDDKANTITLAIAKTKGQPAEEQTFSVAADAKIVVSGQLAKLSEINLEKPANLTLNADKKVASIAQGKIK